MAYPIFSARPEKLGLKAKEYDDVAREVTAKLREAGIDVVDGLDPDEAVGRFPLSYFALTADTDTIIIGSHLDESIDYISKVTKAKYPRKYFLSCDNGYSASESTRECNVINMVTAKPRPSSDGTTRISLFYQEPMKDGQVVKSGDLVYDAMTGTVTYERIEGTRPEINPELYEGYHNPEIRIYTQEISDAANRRYIRTADVYVLGTRTSVDINDLIRKTVKFNIESTGVRMEEYYRGQFRLTQPTLPDPVYLKPLVERMTFSLTDRDMEDSYGEAISVDPLTEDQMQEAVAALKEELAPEKVKDLTAATRGRYYNDGFRKSYVMVMTPAPKGERRPIGHIILGLTDGVHFESCEFAIARTSASFDITDIYIRTEKNGVKAFRRGLGREMSHIKASLGDLKIIKATLEHARNIKNRYAATAAIDAGEESGSAAISASTLRNIASLKFGADFVERCYRMGYAPLADEICEIINDRRAWNRVTSMTDIIPGFEEDAKSLYTCLGMPRAWGKAVFDSCVKQKGKKFSKEDLHDAAMALRIAWKLEEALTEGKPSEMSVPSRALEYAEIWRGHLSGLGLGSGRTSADIERHWLFVAYRDDPIGMANAVRSYHRMANKLKKLSLYNSQYYLTETFQAYCQLKTIGENPESHGVLFEYGLPEGDNKAALEMIQRRCEAAQEVVKSYQAIIDEKKHEEQEARYAEYRNAVKWLECSDKEVSEYYIFKLPTKLYGTDDPLSLQSEGTNQHNCLYGSYLNKLANGEYYVVCMRSRYNPDESLVSIGITRGMLVDQTYASHDRPISAAQALAIKQWVAKVSSRGKGDLKLAAHPAGWCR